MSWFVLGLVILVLGATVAASFLRRVELRGIEERSARRGDARRAGSHKALLQHPVVDLTQCIGCGGCVRACPEDGVLELIHGQAVVVHGARCVGHARCVTACPTGAIAVTLADLADRRDIPAVTDALEARGVEGLFLAGELTGFALVRTAISHGVAVAEQVGKRVRSTGSDPAVLDLCIVGAGPAGLACSLRAKELGLRFVTIDREEIGGTVARYPRRKLVMTQPVHLPLHGRLKKTSYLKEELIELWRAIAAEHRLPIETGVELLGVERNAGGTFRVRTTTGEYAARNVCLALGRRGTPRKLGVEGEQLPKVTYGLQEAESYRDRRVLVVGGGDSAIEAAVGLAGQSGNTVTISYRKHAFFRLKARNETALTAAIRERRITVLFWSEVRAIRADEVVLSVSPDGTGESEVVLGNDDVFVFAGGVPPYPLLEQAGVSFDPADRPGVPPPRERGSGIQSALVVAFLLALGVLAWTAAHADYYRLGIELRPLSPLHEALRPAGPTGILIGVAAAALILWNLAYLLRRSRAGAWIPGSLRRWMTSHVVTGIGALLLALVHGAMAPRAAPGGYALGALAVVVAAGAIGRYLYSFVPRAANGRVLELEEIEAHVAHMSGEWDQSASAFGERVRREVADLVGTQRWKSTFVSRLRGVLRGQRQLSVLLARIRVDGAREGVSQDELDVLCGLTRRAHRTALMSARYEDLRGLLASWRWFHRWLALLMVLLVAIHVVAAVRFGEVDWAAVFSFGRKP